jgi:hypothetical protein
MRIPKSWIPPLTRRILQNLLAEDLIEPKVDMGRLEEEAGELIAYELSLEDRLNDEVREILRKHESEIDRGRLDYRRLFDLTKQKLVKERNLVL